MQKVFYKVKLKDYNKQNVERVHTDINDAKTDYNTMLNTCGITDVKFFIVTTIEEELSKEQINLKS